MPDQRFIPLQTFSKRLQPPVETCRIIPERCMPRISHHMNLRVYHARLVLIDGSWFNNRIRRSLSDSIERNGSDYRVHEIRHYATAGQLKLYAF